MAGHIKIEIDSEVFEFLQKSAKPLIDTPNDVLRRLLFPQSSVQDRKESQPMAAPTPLVSSPTPPAANVDAFVGELLKREIGSGFTRRGRYRLMFESADHLVYVQNFNKQSMHLWYRITEKPWRELQQSKKKALLCFTNPAERFAYIIPVTAVIERLRATNWSRPYLEVNVDPVASRWIELDWNIERYLKSY